MTTQLFNEDLDLTEAQIDTERRQIQGVVLIRAGMSTNRKFYSDEVLLKSVPIFEGVKSYANHPKPDMKGARDIRDITGWYTNVRHVEGKLVADRHFAKTAAGNDAWAIAQEVVSGSAPKNLAGLSINAVGTGRQHKFDDGNGLYVESITAAISVDDVSAAAAGGAYLESAGDLMSVFWENVTFDEFFESRPDYIKRIQNEVINIRRDDSIKAAQAEADTAKAALLEAQAQLETLRAEHEATVANEATARRELAIERLLSGQNLPAAWGKSLRETLLKAPQGEWAAIIESEQAKAKSAGHRTPVSGAGQQISQPMVEAVKPATKPPYDMSKINSPEELVKALRQQP